MKKLIFLFLFIGSISQSFAQEEPNQYDKSNEFKLNAAYLLSGFVEFSYERILSDESSIGVSTGLSFDEDVWNLKFELIPYYRFFFGEKRGAGFFIEANTALYTYDYDYYNGYSSSPTEFNNQNKEYEFGFGLGIAIGGKFVTTSGFVFDVYTGLGRNLLESDGQVYPRLGLTIGKRF
jgi:hypothetical protein